MYIFDGTKYTDLVSKTVCALAVLIASLTLIGCESSDEMQEPQMQELPMRGLQMA